MQEWLEALPTYLWHTVEKQNILIDHIGSDVQPRSLKLQLGTEKYSLVGEVSSQEH